VDAERIVSSMKTTWIAAMTAAIISVSAACGTASAESRLSGKEIRSLFPGNFQARVDNAMNVTVRAHANGTLAGELMGRRDTGIWSINGNQLCIRWSVWLGGTTKCRYVERAGNTFRLVSASGKVGLVFARY